MNTRTCTLCSLPIDPREPAMRAAPIDVREGRVITLAPRFYHTSGACRGTPGSRSRSTRTAAVSA